jgi:hypothetical protein
MKRIKLDWKPVRRGEVYCAPACGRKCTWAEYQQAKERLDTLKLILGRGWRGEVWENLGWHYKAISSCGRIKVHASHYNNKVTYSAFLGADDSAGGTWVSEPFRDPKKAVAQVIAMGKKTLSEMEALLAGL